MCDKSVEAPPLKKTEYKLIVEIVKRVGTDGYLHEIDNISLQMDLVAVHRQFPLQLSNLLDADDFNFYHDICGIMRHMNRETALLEDCFLPRYAR